MLPFKVISDISDSLAGKRVLVRVDFNIPDGATSTHPRILRSLPTIELLQKAGAKIILISHREKTDDSLRPAYEQFSKLMPAMFVEDLSSEKNLAFFAAMQNGDIVLIENLRTWPGEVTNDPAFAVQLAALADMYVDDAFSAAHREHASIVGVPKLLPHYAGLLFADEFKNLSKALLPEHPALAIVAGAKFSTKLPVLQKFLSTFDHIFVGGALANSCFKAKGFEIGKSLFEEPTPELLAVVANPKLLLPSEVTLEDQSIVTSADVSAEHNILDAAPAAIEALKPQIAAAKFIIWNGPVGAYEQGFTAGTLALAEAITASGAETIVGGGDTIGVISPEALQKFSFVSMAGGAMLDFIAKGTLPGIDALK